MNNTYWTKEKLIEVSTIENAITDYKYGFTTSLDGDNKTILMGTVCSHCSKYFEEYRRINHRLASPYCNKCNAIKFN